MKYTRSDQWNKIAMQQTDIDDINPQLVLDIYTFEITATSPMAIEAEWRIFASVN